MVSHIRLYASGEATDPEEIGGDTAAKTSNKKRFDGGACFGLWPRGTRRQCLSGHNALGCDPNQ
jgi:hypothetical protein